MGQVQHCTCILHLEGALDTGLVKEKDCPLHQRRSMHWTAGTLAQQPSEITHLPALKRGDVWDIALVNAEGDNLEEVLESPAAIEVLHAQPCTT